MSVRDYTAREIADLIDRFLSDRKKYYPEWYEFVDCRNRDPVLDTFRKQCEMISLQFQSDTKSLDLIRYDRWQDAANELKDIAARLRDLERNAAK